MPRAVPLKKYSMRRVPLPVAAGRVKRAPLSILMVQMARSESSCAAQESGGGGKPLASPSVPATQDTSVVLPCVSSCRRRVMSSRQNIVKCGSTILLRAGKLSQI